jgi:hypothetical protein
MNKRKEPLSARAHKKNDKEVHKAMQQETSIESSKPKRPLSLAAIRQKAKTLKKHSKRTSSKEKIQGSTPAHPHTESERWDKATRKHIDSSNMILSRKMCKKRRAA